MKINARLLVRLYPRAWRKRYGEELVELLGDRVRPRDVVDILRGAANEWTVHMTGNGYWNELRSGSCLAPRGPDTGP